MTESKFLNIWFKIASFVKLSESLFASEWLLGWSYFAYQKEKYQRKNQVKKEAKLKR